MLQRREFAGHSPPCPLTLRAVALPALPAPCLLCLQRNYGFIMGGNGNLLAAHLIYILGGPGRGASQAGRWQPGQQQPLSCLHQWSSQLSGVASSPRCFSRHTISPACHFLPACSHCCVGGGHYDSLLRAPEAAGAHARVSRCVSAAVCELSTGEWRARLALQCVPCPHPAPCAPPSFMPLAAPVLLAFYLLSTASALHDGTAAWY
jgi:hypothetical protein